MKTLIFILMLFSSVLNASDRFIIHTNAFSEASTIPVLYTCDGKDISPEFSWTNAPAKTQAFALVVSDPDAPSGTFYHWIVYNIPASINHFHEGLSSLPAGAMIAKNSWGTSEYKGPCPPKDSKHHYIFTVYALDSLLKLTDDTDIKLVLDQIKTHSLETTQLTAVYTRVKTHQK